VLSYDVFTKDCFHITCTSYAGVPEFSESDGIVSVLSTTFSSATIEWTPATTSPIAAVSSYIVRAYNDTGLHGVYSTNDGDTLNLTISELEPSTKYYINVAAINIVGPSAPTRNISLITRQFSKQHVYLYHC